MTKPMFQGQRSKTNRQFPTKATGMFVCMYYHTFEKYAPQIRSFPNTFEVKIKQSE